MSPPLRSTDQARNENPATSLAAQNDAAEPAASLPVAQSRPRRKLAGLLPVRAGRKPGPVDRDKRRGVVATGGLDAGGNLRIAARVLGLIGADQDCRARGAAVGPAAGKRSAAGGPIC